MVDGGKPVGRAHENLAGQARMRIAGAADNMVVMAVGQNVSGKFPLLFTGRYTQGFKQFYRAVHRRQIMGFTQPVENGSGSLGFLNAFQISQNCLAYFG